MNEHAQSCLTHFTIPWIVACQAPLSRQEYWIGLTFPSSQGKIPNSGIEPTSPAFAGGFFTTEPLRKSNE